MYSDRVNASVALLNRSIIQCLSAEQMHVLAKCVDALILKCGTVNRKPLSVVPTALIIHFLPASNLAHCFTSHQLSLAAKNKLIYIYMLKHITHEVAHLYKQ